MAENYPKGWLVGRGMWAVTNALRFWAELVARPTDEVQAAVLHEFVMQPPADNMAAVTEWVKKAKAYGRKFEGPHAPDSRVVELDGTLSFSWYGHFTSGRKVSFTVSVVDDEFNVIVLWDSGTSRVSNFLRLPSRFPLEETQWLDWKEEAAEVAIP